MSRSVGWLLPLSVPGLLIEIAIVPPVMSVPRKSALSVEAAWGCVRQHGAQAHVVTLVLHGVGDLNGHKPQIVEAGIAAPRLALHGPLIARPLCAGGAAL